MKRPFPGAEETPDLEVEALAMCVLDRLVCTPPDRRHDLMTREQFINHHVGEVYSEARRKLQPFGAFSFDSETATLAFPDYARALAEAWSFLESQGYLVREPDHPRQIFVGQLGMQRHGTYRGRSASSGEGPPPSGPRKRFPGSASAEPPGPLPQAGSPTQADPTTGGGGSDRPPTVAVLWAHTDANWSSEEAQAWKNTVVSFVQVLRAAGIDADLDLYHGHLPIDWARFGPRAIRESDYVLIAVSPTWRRAFDGENDPKKNAGAVGEANALRGLFREGQDEFLKRVIPVILPGRDDADLPHELRATNSWARVSELTDEGIEDLLRRLTRQPAYPKPPVGRRRDLPPRTVIPGQTAEGGTRGESDLVGPAVRTEQIEGEIDRAEGALTKLPPPSAGPAKEPWDQARESIEWRQEALRKQLAELEGRDLAEVGPAGPPLGRLPTQTFDRAIGNAETELEAILGRLRDAKDDGYFPMTFFLPAEYRQAAADALEDRGLREVRRRLDQAYNGCDRLNTRLTGRFWDEAPIPEQAPARILEDDRLGLVIDNVETALALLEEVRSGGLDEGGQAAVEFGEAWWKREFITGAAQAGDGGEWAEFVGVTVLNRGSKTAKNLWTELLFLDPGGTQLRSMQGRWSHNPRATVGDPFEAPRFTQLDLAPNARPEPLDVAVRFESDGAVFGMNTRNLVSGGRHDIFAIGVSEWVVRIRLRGEGGIDLEHEWRRSRDEFRLR